MLDREFLAEMQPKEIVARLEQLREVLEPFLSLKILDEDELYYKIKKNLDEIDVELKTVKEMMKIVDTTLTTHICQGDGEWFNYWQIYLPCCRAGRYSNHEKIRRKKFKLYDFYMCKSCKTVLFITRVVKTTYCSKYVRQDDEHRKTIKEREKKAKEALEKAKSPVVTTYPAYTGVGTGWFNIDDQDTE